MVSHGEYPRFFNIVPRDEVYLPEMNNPLSLRVVRGLEVSPLFKVHVNELSKGYSQFYNNSDKGIRFKITVIIDKKDNFNGIPLISVLNDFYVNMTPIGVRCNAIDVPDDVYLITDNSSRKQESDNKTSWDLEFTTYNPVNVFKYKNNNTGVNKALKKAKKNKNKKNKKKSTKNASTKNSKLSKCDYKTLTYSAKKKTVKCVKYLQEILNKKNYYSDKIDGWFGKSTLASVKRFQKAYNKKHSSKQLKVNGKVDKATFNALTK